MQASDTVPAFDSVRETVGERIADAPGVLLCLDFDGTLAPIVEEPDDAAMDAACRSALQALLTSSSVDVAVISGRAVDDLRDRVGLDDVIYAGNHGLELQRERRHNSRHDDPVEVHPEAAEYRAAIDEVCAAIEAETAAIPGCSVEHKGVTATVHVRQTPDERVADVREGVEAAVTDRDVDVLDGKQIFEIRPRVDWDKGRVVALLADETPAEWLTIYVGDDATDEDALEVVEPDGLGVVVGPTDETAASVRVPDQAGVVDVLELIADRQDPPPA